MFFEALVNSVPLGEAGSPGIRVAAFIFALLGSALLIWRFLKFTVLPAMRPNLPKEYPYWIPVIGHLRGFVKNSQGLLTQARLYFGNTREPFSVTMGGQTFYIVSRPDDVKAIFRNTTSFTFEIFAREILHDLGCTPGSIISMYGTMEDELKGDKNREKTTARRAREFHIHQMFPGNLLNDIGADFAHYYEKTMSIEHLVTGTKYATQIAPDAVNVSLFTFFSEIFTNAAQDAYFGQVLRKKYPHMAWTLLEFDDLAWQVLFKYPSFLSRKMLNARDRVFDALEDYFASPEGARTDTVWFTRALEKEMRDAGLTNRDIAIMVMTIYWGVATNTRKAGFWLMSYLLFNDELKAVICNEIAPAFKSGEVDQEYIVNDCPRFRGAWDETLRMTAFSSSVRYITRDTVVGNKLLQKGYRIMMPYRQMHLNESVFGDRVEEFASERFVKNPEMRRANMAFGGGATMCPGRHLATQTIMVFVAMLLHKFDVTLDPPNQPFPQVDESIPVLGIIDMKRTHDIQLKLKVRGE
ncbi:cytochrome P450 [Lentithecium fluviatile CBS 122367]|uniref:Cytochrome P450 n=1 Tax=Lentithecium fluviatile CBS 122367 TaxID=1168545 RepID=A0A6G1ILQ0_9PLEO|nr:cytochrome P450 [Lentithecium fluviatile CBS 122367]